MRREAALPVLPPLPPLLLAPPSAAFPLRRELGKRPKQELFGEERQRRPSLITLGGRRLDLVDVRFQLARLRGEASVLSLQLGAPQEAVGGEVLKV